MTNSITNLTNYKTWCKEINYNHSWKVVKRHSIIIEVVVIIRQLGKTYKEHYIIWQKTIELTNRVFCGEWLGGSSKLQSFEEKKFVNTFFGHHSVLSPRDGLGGGETNNILVNYLSCFQNNTCYWQWSLTCVRNLFSWKNFLFENKIFIKFTIFC